MDDLPRMLTAGEIARVVSVNPKTVTRWARAGKLTAVRTPGGHRRYPLATVLDFLHEMGLEDATARAAIAQVTSSV